MALDRRVLDRARATIGCYYTAKVMKHGATPLGVDWTCNRTQELRFAQLLRIADLDKPSTLNDLGCGYGALLTYLAARHPRAEVDYCGFDLSAAMIDSAKSKWRRRLGVDFAVSASSTRVADYSVASGVFNVNLDQSLGNWEELVEETLIDLGRTSRKGFAVNFVAPANPQRAPSASPLYQPRPERWIPFLEHTLGGETRLVQHYGLREYTLLFHHNGHDASAPRR